MARSVIVSAVRTPFGKLGGGLARYSAPELGAIVIREAVDRAGIDPREPQYAIMGQVLQAGAGQAPARQAAIGAGLPLETPADTINKVCASSSREEQDEWALRSHRRAVAAADEGRFRDELVPVDGLEADESPRRDTSLEKLASLAPVFDPEGTTTAGNAPGVNDGASCVVVCSEEWARSRGIEPLATIVSQGYVGDDFAYLARATARAGSMALERAGKTIDDVARVEINEAFSSVARYSTALLGADEERVNVNGGAVALGHPIGASGGRILATMVHELRRNGGGLGLAAICSGGGQGDALLIEAYGS